MKRRVKSWEDLLRTGQIDEAGDIRGVDNYFFDAAMRKYCGQDIELEGGSTDTGYVGNYEYRYFSEWMLEPIIATDTSLREAVQEVIGIFEDYDHGDDINVAYIINRLKTALND